MANYYSLALVLLCWIELRLGTPFCYDLLKMDLEIQFMAKMLIIKMLRTFPIIF